MDVGLGEEALKSHISLIFFTFTSFFLLFSLLILLIRSKRWCGCDICRAYVTSSWSSDFDNLCDWYAHLLRRSPTRTIHVHVLGNTITANPANVEHILKSRFDNYPKGRPFAAILGDFLGRGIFNSDGDHWLFQRKMAGFELSSPQAKCFALRAVAVESSQRLLPLLSAAAAGDVIALDLQDVFRRFAFDTICKVSFGVDPGCLELSLPVSKFAAAFDAASRLSAARATAVAPVMWKVKRLLDVGSERELRRAVRLVHVLAEEVIRQRRKLGFATHQDLLSRFMASIDDDRFLRDIVISFLLAGRDTVASGLTGFFFLLSSHPAVRSTIADEIERVMGGAKTGVPASYDELREMNYLHAAVYESLRLYPPVQFDSKFCNDDDVLPDGTYVVRGTRVTYHAYAMGRMPEAWGSDCEEFRPERWLRGGVFTPESPFKFPVFQAGVRVCLGKDMALTEMKAVIVSVVASGFDFEVVNRGRSPPKFAPGLTASLKGGLPVRVRRRAVAKEKGGGAFI